MYVCLDIGGSSVKTAVMSADGSQFYSLGLLPTCDDFQSFFKQICVCIEKAMNIYKIQGIALSAPGAVDWETGVIHGTSALAYIHDPNLKELLFDKFQLPVSIENDANCAALGEVFFGENTEIRDLAFVVCGTGIGGAIIKNREIHRGIHLHGGEFGYLIMNPLTFQTWSEVGTTRTLVEEVRNHYGDQSIDGKEVFARSKLGDEICQKAIDTFYTFMAIGILNVQYAYDPEYILVSGAISQQGDFVYQINQKIATIMERNSAWTIVPKIMKCTHGKDANLYGALAQHLNEYCD